MLSITVGFVPPADEAVKRGGQEGGATEEVPDVRLQEAGGFGSEADAEPGFAEVAQEAGEDDDAEEFRQRGAHDAGTDHEDLERHRYGKEGGYENCHHTVAAEPFTEACGASFRSGLLHEAAAAFVCRPEQHRVAGGGADHGEARAEPGDGRTFHRNQDQYGIENARDRHSGGIENGENQNTDRSPGDQNIGQVA